MTKVSCISKFCFLLSLGILLLVIFQSESINSIAMIQAKMKEIHAVLPFLILATAGMIALQWSRLRFCFSLADGIVLAIAMWVLAGYDSRLNAEPEKLLMGGQLLALWFSMRIALNNVPNLRIWVLMLLCGVGIIEAVTGLRQLYGMETSNHGLFRMTGHFFNPGPYSGFLAMLLPIGFWFLLRFSRFSRRWKSPLMYAYYAEWLLLLSVLLVLPAGQSRIAWVAAIVSCLFVYMIERNALQQIMSYSRKSPVRMLVASMLVSVFSFLLIGWVYSMKKDSADGRFLMWKVTTKAIADNDWRGTGLGGFPADYAKAQAAYFSNGGGTDQERFVAGSPEYAFNEYLQIVAEHGFVGLFFFLGLICVSFYRGLKSKQTGAAGSIIALLVFSLASYPLQLPEFWLVFIILLALLNTSDKSIIRKLERKSQTKMRCYAFCGYMILLGLISVSVAMEYQKYYEASSQWGKLKSLYGAKAYEEVKKDYEALLPLLAHKPEFLFEAAQCHGNSGNHQKAITLLERAERLSADPMIGYMIAKNYQQMGEFDKAEIKLKNSIDVLPERLYPYYLLTKLYADPRLNDSVKFKEVAYIVLSKIPKVESQATREMRAEIRKMLNLLE